MYGTKRRETWTLYNAEVRVQHPEETFTEVDVEVVIERNRPPELTYLDISGTFAFRSTPPAGTFFADDGCPRKLDIVAETQYETVELEAVLMTSEADGEMEFVAIDADKTTHKEKPDMTLEETLEKHWPPARVLVTCETCGDVLFDTDEGWPALRGASYMATLIKTFAGKHEADDGHRSIDIGIDKQPAPVRDVDCTITVNE